MWRRLTLSLVTVLAVACTAEIESTPPEQQGLVQNQTAFLYYPLDSFYSGVTCDWDCYYNDNGSPHAALDLHTGPGKQPVRASADGMLTVHGWVGGCGNMATIAHPNGYTTKYCHFSAYSGGSRFVKRGDVIGTSGATGYTDPPGYDHVHFVLINPSGNVLSAGCPPGIADNCNDSGTNFWVTRSGVVVRAGEAAPRARFDFDGDGCDDIVGRLASDASLRLYAGNCAGGYSRENVKVGSSWDDFDLLTGSPDFNGDGCADIIGRRKSDASLRLYAGNCAGGYSKVNVLIGTSWSDFDWLSAAADFDGDGCVDVVGRRKSDASLRLYAGNCAGGYSKVNVQIGSSWSDFASLVLVPDWNGDGCADIIGRRKSDASLRLYAGNCAGGYSKVNVQIGSSWSDFDWLSGKDWSGDGCGDIVGRRQSDGSLRVYAGNCAGGWATQNVKIGYGFAAFDALL